MRKSLERLATLRRHLLTSTQHGSISASPTQCNNGPALLVTPSSCLVDEKIKIHLDGLGSNQLVTLVADVTENGTMFEARCLYQADSNGEIDNCSNASLAGSFKGEINYCYLILIATFFSALIQVHTVMVYY